MTASVSHGAAANTIGLTARDWLWLIGGMIALTILAVWPHVRFSLLVDDLAFFKGAYDEDSYALFPYSFSGFRIDRLLSGTIYELSRAAAAGSHDIAQIVIDGISLPAIFLAAYLIAAVLFRNPASRTMLALLLIFSPDLFSLGNQAVFAIPGTLYQQFRSLFGPVGAYLVPSIETSYLGLIRSPEPQISYVVALLFVAFLLKLLRDGSDQLRVSAIAGLAVLNLVLVTSYSLVSYPMLLIEAFAAVVLAASRFWRRAALLALMVVIAGSASAIGSRLLVGGTGILFASRLPVVTISVVLAIPLLATIVIILARRRFADGQLWMAAAFAGLPIALTNQQLLTGVMISTKDWERYITFPLLVLGAAILLSRLCRSGSGLLFRIMQVSVIGSIALVIIAASLTSYSWWLPDNIASVAMARAVRSLPPTVGSGVVLVMDRPGLAPLLRVRTSAVPELLLDYTNIFEDPIPPSSGREFIPTRHSTALFEYWRRTVISPEEAAQTLQAEAASRGGYYMGFLLNVCEYWHPCSDNRALSLDRIASLIPGIIASYEDYLVSPGQFNQTRFAFMRTYTAGVAGVTSETPIATGEAAGTLVGIYLED